MSRQMTPSQISQYTGNKGFGRYHGKGRLMLPDNVIYEGEFFNGLFHGQGTLHFAEGKVEGLWKAGKYVDGSFIFSDGLNYAPQDWKYCSEEDRRFYAEILKEQGTETVDTSPKVDTKVPRVEPGKPVGRTNEQLDTKITTNRRVHRNMVLNENERNWLLEKIFSNDLQASAKEVSSTNS